MMKNLWPLIVAVIYALWPYDLIPDLLIGWGWIDDLVLLIFLGKIYFAYQKANRPRTDDFDAHGRSDKNNGQARSNRNHASGKQEAKTSSFQNPYTVLGVDKDASIDDIKKAYRQLAKKYHPDRVDHLGEEFKVLAEKRFKEVQQAYQELMGKHKTNAGRGTS